MKELSVSRYNFRLSAKCPCHVSLHRRDRPVQRQAGDVHEALHLGILMAGGFRGRFGGHQAELRAGDCYLTVPWEPHRIDGGRSGFELLLITFSQTELLKFFFAEGEKLRRLIMLPAATRLQLLARPAVRAAADDFLRRFREQPELPDGIEAPPEDHFTALRRWQQILGLFIEIDATLEFRDGDLRAMGDILRLQPALTLLHEGAGQTVPVAAAATACRLSEGRFGHLFRQVFGIAYGAYARQYRLAGAVQAMLTDNLTLDETAGRWGFCNASHFSRCFRQQFGLSPGAYRQRALREPQEMDHFTMYRLPEQT